MEPHITPEGRIDWAQVAENLKANPGQFLLIKENTHTGVAQYLRNRESPVLFHLGGVITVKTRNTRYEEGRRRVDVYASWVPIKKEK